MQQVEIKMEAKSAEMHDKAWSRVLETRKTKGDDDVAKLYKDWSAEYEQDLHSLDYNGPQICGKFLQKYAKKFGFDQTCKILDACTGTGAVAQQIRDLGYANIDGHDGSQDMLDQAVKLNRFNKTYCGFIGDGKKLQIEDNTYHVVTMAGAFGNSHLKCNALLELIRIVRPGGVIINVTRNNVMTTVEEYHQLPELLESWSKSDLIEVQEITVPEEKFYTDFDAIVHVLKVL